MYDENESKNLRFSFDKMNKSPIKDKPDSSCKTIMIKGLKFEAIL